MNSRRGSLRRLGERQRPFVMMRTVTTLVLFGALFSAVSAGQEQLPSTRVRITGMRVYNRPGVIEVSPDLVAGSGIIVDGSLIHVVFPPSGKLTVLNSGKRIVGITRGVQDGAVILEAEGRNDTVHIPLDAIARLEISKGHGSRAVATFAAIGIGIGAFYGGTWLAIAACGFDCPGVPVSGLAAGSAGSLLGARIGRERWKAVPTQWVSDPATRVKSTTSR